jgi:Flp pilus assembly protein TadG
VKLFAKRNEGHGQALVEFALVIPIFLVIVLGIFDLGRAVFANSTLTNAAREGARLAIVNQNVASVQSRTVNQAISLGLANGDVAVHYYLDDGSIPVAVEPLPANDSACSASTMPLDCVVVVRATYDWTAITPLIGPLVGPLTLTATAVQPIEFSCPNETITTAANCPRQP